MSAAKRIERITKLLELEYRTPDLGNQSDPIAELVFILLSEKTDDNNFVEAFNQLDAAFDSWESVRDADVSDIAKLIRVAGMANRRAKLIKSALNAITVTYGCLDLSRLRDQPNVAALSQLSTLPGIGKKAARCILMYAFGRHVLPVDIHTYRLAIRMGLIARTVSFDEAHDLLEALIPWNFRRRFHINAVAHGRERCRSKAPRCDGCPLARMCIVAKAESEPEIRMRPKPLALELFSGAGGMSCGFSHAGFQIVQAIEADQRAAETFRANHCETDLIVGNVANLDPLTVARRASIRRGDLTLLFGGPPCQGFSESNRRTRTLENPRNHLYRQFFRYVAALEPQWFVLENVAGLKTLADGAVLSSIIKRASELGYQAEWQELNAANFGVPQTRRRIFVVGNSLGLPVQFPQPTHGTKGTTFVSVKDAISDLPHLPVGANCGCLPYRDGHRTSDYQKSMRNGKDCVDGNVVTNNSKLVIKRYKQIRQGQNWEAIPAELMDNYFDSSRCHTGIYYRLKWGEPSKVIGNFRKNMLIHPTQNRGLSVREAARLQSFPDSYKFIGSIGFQQQQVADAVPPLLAEAVANAVLDLRTKGK
ncbi:DNA (cytosine-5-)-methyltransferase [Calycomorphotria hydatis]|uniref:DNA (cytosine-5-)-methyltransferase n=1 Tax=Calycomorphotria hydatis TaxID=2528027 RepID=A0A517TE73_9PLAN|nr:DNA (cytosine-5-)-methyltransferase [Calycomorphotria hydatis]QDT66662.1 Modification methylase BspRI [Calycomorphotria hydatis]